MRPGKIVQGSGTERATIAVSKGVHTLIYAQAKDWNLPVGHTVEILIMLGFEQLKQRYDAKKNSENPLKIMSE